MHNTSALFSALAHSRFGEVFLTFDDQALYTCDFVLSAQAPTDTPSPQAQAIAECIGSKPTPLALRPSGTPFQQAVWRALTHIPFGETRSYQQLADAIGQPQAVRAVANAIARNPISWFIPCHRVIRSNGQLGGYAWGQPLKQTLLDWEQRHVRARD
jgi:O-6-methylguanine DNA methyltransferase